MVPSVALALALLQASAPGRLGPRLEHRVHNYRVSADSFPQALAIVAGRFRIPMGIEWIRNRRTVARIDMSWKDATVRQVITSIAAAQPGYALNEANGLVHVFPCELASDPSNFLNLKIHRIEAHGELPQIVTLRLQRLVRQTISPSPPMSPGGGMGYNIGSTPGEGLLAFRLKDVTVEKVMDVISSLSGNPIWVVTFCDHCGLTPGRFRRVTGLWLSKPAPDDQQPVWDMLRWDQRIPTQTYDRK